VPVTRTRKPTEVRRREIAEAVLRVIGQQGATSLTAATIAAEVGVTPGAIFRHFTSLDGVLEAAVERAVEQVAATFPDPGAVPVDRLMALAAARIDLFAHNGGIAWLLLSDQVYLTLPEAALAHLDDLVRRSRKFLLEAMRAGAKDGTIRCDVAPEVLLLLFTGTVHAIVGTAGVHRRGRQPTPTRVLDALRLLLSPVSPTRK
jgi:AcrR family transcriptional regulator